MDVAFAGDFIACRCLISECYRRDHHAALRAFDPHKRLSLRYIRAAERHLATVLE